MRSGLQVGAWICAVTLPLLPSESIARPDLCSDKFHALAKARVESLTKKLGAQSSSGESLSEETLEAQWVETLPSLSEINLTSREDPVNLGDKWGKDSVQLVNTIEIGRIIFRPLLTPETSEMFFASPFILRKTLAAYKLNRLLGLNTVPTARVATVNGRIGVISDYIIGEKLRNPLDPTQWTETALAANHLFEFIVANLDFQASNFISESKERLVSIDHDLAFALTVSPYNETLNIGSALPNVYTKEWTARLRSITQEEIRFALQQDLTPQEIAAVWHRIELIRLDLTDKPERP